MNLGDNFWTPLTPSTKDELKAYEKQIYRESSLLYQEKPNIANDTIEKLLMFLDIKKIVHDMYVWQRIDAVKRGAQRAKDDFILVGAEK